MTYFERLALRARIYTHIATRGHGVAQKNNLKKETTVDVLMAW